MKFVLPGLSLWNEKQFLSREISGALGESPLSEFAIQLRRRGCATMSYGQVTKLVGNENAPPIVCMSAAFSRFRIAIDGTTPQ